MANQQFKARLTINQEKLDRLNSIISHMPQEPAAYGGNEEMERLVRSAIRHTGSQIPLYSTEVWFPGGVTAEVNVYPPRDKEASAYSEATLYDGYGEEIASSGPSLILNGEWILRDEENNCYSIDIESAPQKEERGAIPEQFNATMLVDPEELDTLNRIMCFSDQQDDFPEVDEAELREFTDSLAEKSEPLFQKEVRFPDGARADILVTPADSMEDKAFAQAFLYDADGIQIGYTDPYFTLDQDWTLHGGNGAVYTVDVQERKRDLDKTSLGKELSELRGIVFRALSLPEQLNRRVAFLERREEAYAALTQELPKALDAIEERLEKQDPERSASLAAGNYLYTGRMNQLPFGKTREEEAAKFVPALRAFADKIRTAGAVHDGTLSEDAPVNGFPVDAIMYLDAARELENTAPRFFRDCLSFRNQLCTNLSFISGEEREAYREASDRVDTLRGRLPATKKESPAEKAMREVYSAHRDIVDYDKLNQMTVDRLTKKVASDRDIREVAEIARTINPAISNTKAYAKRMIHRADRKILR